VWISRIGLVATDTIRFFFATHNVTDAVPSQEAIEFATLDLTPDMIAGQRVAIVPLSNLRLDESSSEALSQQHFGRGHVALSSLWGGTSDEVAEFFTVLATLPDGELTFSRAATLLSSFGVHRVPKYTPSLGESQALVGSTASRTSPIPPSSSNRYVCEQDQGSGNQVDLEAVVGITPVTGIERYGYSGGLAHRIITLCVDHSKVPTGSEAGAETFYEDHVLPRLTALLGRPPVFGDYWYTGTSLLFYNGDTWQS
jgi:hypothetical protein